MDNNQFIFLVFITLKCYCVMSFRKLTWNMYVCVCVCVQVFVSRWSRSQMFHCGHSTPARRNGHAHKQADTSDSGGSGDIYQ